MTENSLVRPIKVSVIGGSGFIGTRVCSRLSKKQVDFEIIDLKKSKRFPEKTKIGDVRDLSSLRAAITGNMILNLAAVHSDDVIDKSEYYATNVHGAENIAEIAGEKGINKIIFTSSVAVYGFANTNTGEDGKIEPFNDYGASKFNAEKVFNEWYNFGNRSLIIVRPTVVFGEGNRGNVYNLLKQISSGLFVMIGSGQNVKSIAYVENVAAFLEHCIATKKKNMLVNYVDTPDMTMQELVKFTRSLLKRRQGLPLRLPVFLGMLLGYVSDVLRVTFRLRLPISSIRIKKFVATTQFSSAKHELDDFSAPYSIKEGLRRTIESEFLQPNPDREIFYSE